MAKQDVSRRGKNFSKPEDRQICVSWVYTTQDPVKGTDQNVTSFWAAVFKHATAGTPSLSSRTPEALRQRFGAISRSVMKFSGCNKSVQRLNKSGTSSTDKFDMALELYKADHKEDFKYLDCYEVLKQCPKFNMSQPSPKTPKPSDEDNNPGTLDLICPIHL
ncbi:uncharacterized protein LOC134290536 [Aedes albopictus]|uniref:No apical meristem-associated C-terminal domain-containing protein n=1 Tax=Aedes albopictus TaxID=7160 RepID=A0ABM1Z039_AEDAL